MGADWRHRIMIESRPANVINDAPLPIRIAGENARPPENVGGPHGYASSLKTIGNGRHEQHVDMVRWTSGVFDPKGFDLNRINRGWKDAKARRS